jgi:hypothetical protein
MDDVNRAIEVIEKALRAATHGIESSSVSKQPGQMSLQTI